MPMRIQICVSAVIVLLSSAGLLTSQTLFGEEKVAAKPVCLRIGHRGAPTLAPENTVAAMRAAIKAGVDGIEFDIHTTADHKMIVIHDGGLARTTDGGNARVTTKTLAELRALDAGSWGEWKGGKFVGEKLPIPEEVIHEIAVGGVIPVVHIKDTDVIPGTMRILADEKVVDRAIMFSFDYQVMERFEKEYPHVKKGWILDKKQLDESGGFQGAIAKALQAKCDLVNFRCPLATPEAVAACHEAKLPVFAWDVNKKSEMEALIRMGVDGMLVDDVPMLNATLEELTGR
jgi:glycerophosphoryl diester phosphodiesterase